MFLGNFFRACIYFSFFKDFIYLKEKGREGEQEGEKHGCERETSICCLWYVPSLGLEPAIQAYALMRNHPRDLVLTMANQLSHTGQGIRILEHIFINSASYNSYYFFYNVLVMCEIGFWN